VSVVPPHPMRRRVLAMGIGFCAAGVGHYFLGAGKAGAVWAASVIGALFAAVAAVLLGLPIAALVGVGLALAVHVATLIDLLRPRPACSASPATSRVVALVVLAFGLGEGFSTVVRGQLVEAFRIPGESMSPTLEPGDEILVSKLRRSPVRGDVVIFHTEDGEPYAKRVVAVAGDVVEMRGSAVWLNGQELPQASTAAPCPLDDRCRVLEETSGGRTYRIAVTDGSSGSDGAMAEREVPRGHLFVLGDARDWSRDSRIYGAIPVDRVVGTLEFVWWPSARFGAR